MCCDLLDAPPTPVSVCSRLVRLFLTLLAPLHLLDLVHGTLEDVALVGLDAEAGDVAHVGRQEFSQLLDVATLQLPPPLLQTGRKGL